MNKVKFLVNICTLFVLTGVAMAQENTDFDTAVSEEKAYSKYKEFARGGEEEEAWLWLSLSAMLGHEKAILEFSSSCLGRKRCGNEAVLRGLLEPLIYSHDSYTKSYAHILLGRIMLRLDGSRESKQLALDNFFLAHSYGDEAAIPYILPVLKELSVADANALSNALDWIDVQVENVKPRTILYENLVSAKEELKEVKKGDAH